jgi:hypothetical protein
MPWTDLDSFQSLSEVFTKMLRTMRASWPIARTTANQIKSVTAGTRNLRGKEKRISSEKHHRADYSSAKHCCNWGRNRKLLRCPQGVYSSVHGNFYCHKKKKTVRNYYLTSGFPIHTPRKCISWSSVFSLCSIKSALHILRFNQLWIGCTTCTEHVQTFFSWHYSLNYTA